MSGILATSTSALLAFQRSLQTVSHNVANVSTEGYTRQRVELSNRAGAPSGAGFAGAGVQVDTVRRLGDQFVISRLLDSGAELGRLDQLSLLAGRLDASFTDPSTSLSVPWSNYFDAAQAVATDPSSTAAREGFLAAADALAGRFRYLDQQLDSLETETNARLVGSAEEVTRLSGEIARLNTEVIRQRAAAGGQPPNDLLDQRDLLVSKLNTLIGVTTLEQDDGALNVFSTGGQALVIGNRASTVATAQDPFQPQRVNIVLSTQGSTVRLPDSALGGEIRGLIEFRSQVLDPTSRQLGLLATSVANLSNDTNALGVDLYGLQGEPIFATPPIQPLTGLSNTGTATLSATLVDLTGVAPNDIELRFDGAVWSARNPATGAAIPMTGSGTPGDPFLVNGTALVLGGGGANAGDSFLIQPTAGAGGRMNLIMSDPRQIAAAAPIRSAAAVSNLGDGVARLSVVDRFDPNLGLPVDIEFIDGANYTLNGGGPFPWVPGTVISANGWQLRIDGQPAPGDDFSIRATAANSSDNTNARALAQLDDLRVLNGGTGSLNTALRESITAVGAAARQAESGKEAQDAIQQQLIQERQSTSGVNLDEEASNMLRFQQAYQAAAQLIGTADTIFQSLLGVVRR